MPKPKKRAPKPQKLEPTAKKRPAPKRKTSAPTERRADPALIERTLDLIRAHERATATSLRRVGAQILHDYYNDNTELAQSNDPTKPKSYARLVELAATETDWDAIDFRNAVTAEIVARTLPSTIANALEPTYLIRLLAIDDPTKRTEIATRIARDEVRGQDAKDLITQHAGTIRRGGPKAMSAPAKLASSIEKALERSEEAGADHAHELRRLPDDLRTDLATRLRTAADRLRDLAAKVDPR